MKTTPARFRTIIPLIILATMPGVPAMADIQVTTTKSLTIQPTGPRQGDNGSRYFNFEGAKNEKYASYGVLVFELPMGGEQAGDVDRLSLRRVQSVPRFAKDGKVRFVLAEPPDRGMDRLAS
jgi:hypothetical protein